MKGAERVLWFRLPDNRGEEWTIWLCTYAWMARLAKATEHPHLLGLTEFEQREIMICASQDRPEQNETLLHEVVHFVRPDLGELEEAVIAELSPKLYPVLERLGFRWPRRPRGAARIERLARRQAEESDG